MQRLNSRTGLVQGAAFDGNKPWGMPERQCSYLYVVSPSINPRTPADDYKESRGYGGVLVCRVSVSRHEAEAQGKCEACRGQVVARGILRDVDDISTNSRVKCFLKALLPCRDCAAARFQSCKVPAFVAPPCRDLWAKRLAAGAIGA